MSFETTTSSTITNTGSYGLVASYGGLYSISATNYKLGGHSLYFPITSSTGCIYPSSGSYVIPSTGFTLSFWFRIPSTTITANSYPCLFGYNPGGSGTSGRRLIIGFTPNGSVVGGIYFICGSSGGENMVTIPIATAQASPYNLSTTGGWNHIGLSIDSSGNWILLINGYQQPNTVATTNLSSMTGGAKMYLGIELGQTTTYITGNIDEVRFYNTPLTLAQLQTLYLFYNSIPN